MRESGESGNRSSLPRDFDSIITEVLWSNDLRDVFAERRWPASVIDQIYLNLLRDEDFLRRLRSAYAAVEDRATRLDEHVDEKPIVRADDFAGLREKPRARTLILVFGAILTFAIAVPLLVLPDWFVLQLVAMFMIAAALYWLPWIDRVVADSLPPALEQRRAWGRHRWRLRAGFTRLRWDWKTTVRNEVVLPEILARINRGVHRTFSHDLRIYYRFLAGRSSASVFIPTEAVRRLGRELSQTASGAIALAGRRGVGKTTLLRALESGMLPGIDVGDRLTVVVPAPARYQLREFVLHLHATVCRAVLEALGNPRVAHGVAVLDRWEHHSRSADRRATWKRAARCFIRATAYAVLAVALAAMIWQRRPDLSSLPGVYGAQARQLIEAAPALSRDNIGKWLLMLLGAGAVVLSLLASALWLLELVTLPLRHGVMRAGRRLRERARRCLLWWRDSAPRSGVMYVLTRLAPVLPPSLRPRVSSAPASRVRARATLTGIERGRPLHQLSQPLRVLATLATEQLRRIRFLQTHTSGWSGKVEGPRALGMTVTRSIAHAEQPLTQPEVVDQLRGFLQHAATTLMRARQITGIAIAIDELDKFADPAQAHEFINEIKTVFGVDNCVFLISVSDDALASFELRGIPVRDALDSAFTAMITVDPFTLAEAHDWLDHRLIGLPSPYACLCYALSAGIPRELERAAATLLDIELDHMSGSEAFPGGMFRSYPQLAHVTRMIIAADVAAKLRAFTFTVHQHPPGELASQVIVTLNTVGDLTHPDDNDLIERLDALAAALCARTEAADDAELVRTCREAAGFCHLCAAILEIFDDDLDEATLDALSAEALPTLAEARRALAVEPLLTWSLVNTIREQRAQLRADTA
ncbi:hypothetical protein SAMN05421854_114155 [Amycolatopsis rubida]|uniref:Uncharacterized protein n=2 Tax=Amycolatopsis rubida TaxID=112413 RepID=A0A1I5ZAS5_9PSEU|nr:hypothetical protein SAMN05421854_114155 [Amycolatopsis rubida]